MSERTTPDSAWLAELADRAMRWAEGEDRRWGEVKPTGFAASLAWTSAWTASRFARLGGNEAPPLLADGLPLRLRGEGGGPLGPRGAPTIPQRISVSEPEPSALLRAASTLWAHGGRELSIGSGAARMWRHFEPVLGPRLAARDVCVRLGGDGAVDPTRSGAEPSAGEVLSLDTDVERSDPEATRFGGAPVDVVIAPYLHDRRDLRRLGDHLASELAAPAPGVGGVRLFVSERWLQRAALREHVEARLAELAHPTGDGARAQLRWHDATDEAGGGHAITERALDAADTAELFDAARAALDEGPSSSVAASAYVAPFVLEDEAAAASFRRWRATHPAGVVVLNQRASHAFASGRVPWCDERFVLPALGEASGERDGPAGAAPSRRSYLEAPFLSPIERSWMLGARVRFERGPTRLAAARLLLLDGLARF